MDPNAIREFVGRRWDLVEREKSRLLRERFEREGTTMGLQVLAELRQRLDNIGTPPSESARSEDFADHLAWVEKLGRIRNGLARR